MRSVPKVFSPTPWILLPGCGKEPENLLFPELQINGFGSHLFQKGRAALGYILKKLHELNPERNEVVFPAYNAQSLAIASVYAGLKIILVDIDTQDFFFNTDKLSNALTEKTLVVIFPYNWGIIPDLEKNQILRKLVKDNNSFVIDDFASTVPGSANLDYFNRNAEIFLFSYGKTKIFSLLDGGYFFISENFSHYSSLKEKIENEQENLKYAGVGTDIKKMIANFPYKLYTNSVGFWLLSKFRLTQTEILPDTCNFDDKPLAPHWNKRLKKMISRSYIKTRDKRFQCNLEYHSCLKDNKSISLFKSTAENTGSRFPILMPDKKSRDQIKGLLNSEGIGAGSGFVRWIGGNDFLKEHIGIISKNQFPNAIDFSERILTLPAHARVKKSDIHFIADTIQKCL